MAGDILISPAVFIMKKKSAAALTAGCPAFLIVR